MANEKAPSRAEQMFGDFAPALVGFTDDMLFAQVWRVRSCRGVTEVL